MNAARSIAVTLVLSVLCAALGAWGAAEYVLHRMRPEAPLHELIHEKLRLTDTQRRQLEGIERDHDTRQRVLEAEMRAANAELAKAFQDRKSYTPEVQAAIDRSHHAMADAQKETMQHVLAMRAVLTPEQAARFDDTVVKSLTQDPR